MKIFEIIDEENNMSIGVLQYYEKEKTVLLNCRKTWMSGLHHYCSLHMSISIYIQCQEISVLCG